MVYLSQDLYLAVGILKEVHARFIIYQLAKALKYLHSGKVIHRDLKPSNILVNSNCTIKLCDFGLVRSLVPGKSSNPVLTEGVATRWYRSPEVLLGSKSYSTPADIWSFGCIVYEILTEKPLFTGNSTLDQVQKICSFTGYPSEQDILSLESQVSRSLIKQMKISTLIKSSNILKDLSPMFVDFLQRILVFNPAKRLTIQDILSHEVVQQFRKPQQELSCNRQISTSIDDNKKFTVQQYRKLVYGINNQPKQKGLSSSLGAGSVSPKYNPISSKPTTTVTYIPNSITSIKSQINKKYSFDKLKPNNHNFSTQNIQNKQKPSEKLLLQKPGSKFPFSTVQAVRSEGLLPKKQIPYDVPNREQTDNINNITEHQDHKQFPSQINNQNSSYVSKYNSYVPVQTRIQQNNKYVQNVQNNHNFGYNPPQQSFIQNNHFHNSNIQQNTQFIPNQQLNQHSQIGQHTQLNQHSQINQHNQINQVNQVNQSTLQQSNVWRPTKPNNFIPSPPQTFQCKQKKVQIKSPKFIPINRSEPRQYLNGMGQQGFYQS